MKIKIPAISATLEDICRGYEEFMNQSQEDKYKKIPIDITEKLNPTKKQIEEFSRILPKYKSLDYFTGCTANYLTALMQASKDESFVLDMRPLNPEGILLNFLGYKLNRYLVNEKIVKELIIKGNVGDFVGHDAEKCPIIIEGNAGGCVGCCAEDCPITIKGNAGNSVGHYAVNCPITIEGDAGDYVGSCALYCLIKIKGSYGSLSERIGAGTKIYQWENRRWRKIWPKN